MTTSYTGILTATTMPGFSYRGVFLGIVSALLVLVGTGIALAQTETGGLTVRVEKAVTSPDEVREPISGATVRIIGSDTGQSRVEKTGSNGEALFSNLEPGIYRVIVTDLSSGRQSERTVTVSVGAETRLLFRLQLGIVALEAKEEVVVTTRLGAPNEITSARQRELLELPNINNDITPLLQVVPGAVATGSSLLGKVVIDGKGKDQQTMRLDGIDATPAVELPSGDTIAVVESFQRQSVALNQKDTGIVAGAFSPQYAPGTGSIVETVTQSGVMKDQTGLNAWKFQMYEFLRNDALDARNSFDFDGKNAIRRSQFGAKLSGPISGQKSFFFVGYEGIRGRTEKNLYEAVPIETFCRCAAGPVSPFLSGFIRQGSEVVPGASLNSDFVVARRRARTTSNANALDARLDFLPFAIADDVSADLKPPKSSDQLTLRFTRQAADIVVPDGITERQQRQHILFANVLAKAQLFSKNYIHEIKVGLNESRAHADVEILPASGLDLSKSLVTIGGAVQTAGLPGNPQTVPIASFGGLVKGAGRGFNLTPYSIIASYAITRNFNSGAHELSAGTEARLIRIMFDRLGGLTYAFSDINALRAGTPGSVTFLSDLSGDSPFGNTRNSVREGRQEYYMGYFQMRSKLWAPGAQPGGDPVLTLVYGIRYDYFGPVREKHDRAVVVDPLSGQILPSGTEFYRASKNNFEPRFGLAYALPFASGLLAQTTLRAGAGIYLGVPRIGDLLLPIESDRFSTGLPAGSFPTDPRDLIRNYLVNPETRQFQPLAFARNFSTPERAYKWEASLTRKIGSFGDLKAGYAGNVGRNLPLAAITNPIIRVDTNSDPTKSAIIVRQFDIIRDNQVFKPFGEFFFRTSEGRSSYNAMTISLQRDSSKHGTPRMKLLRFTTFRAQYTLSRNVGNVSGTLASDPSNFDSDYGYNAADARHSLTVSGIYSLSEAFQVNESSFLGGWAISPAVTARSGLPLIIRLDRPDVVYVDSSGTVFSSPAVGRRATINTPGGGATGGTRVPDFIPGINPYLRNGTELLNPAAFATPAPGTLGNLKRGQLCGPGSVQFDLAMMRRILDKEKTHGVTANFKVEINNLFNHVNFNNPTASLPNALGTSNANNQIQPGFPFTRKAAGSFGVFSAADPGRLIQFSLTLNLNEGFR